MNNYNNPNAKYGVMPQNYGGMPPNSYGMPQVSAIPYQGGYSPYNQNNGFNQQPQQPPIKTNHIYVTSLEDALARSVEPNSEIVYLHQDKPLLFNVKTDMLGKKTYTVLELHPPIAESTTETASVMPNVDTDMFVSREEFNELKKQIKPLLDRINKSKEKVGESND